MTSAPNPGGPSWQQEPAAPNPAGHPTSSSFYRWIRGLDVTRTPDRWLGGVAGGVARRTGLDLALVRGLIVVLAVFGGIGVLLYGLAWALLPEPDGRIHLEQAGRGSWTSGLTGAVVLVTIGLWGPNVPFRGDGGGFLWTLFWIGAVVFFVYWIVNRSSSGRVGPPMPDGGPQGFGGGPGSGPVPPSGPAPYGPAPFGPAPFGPSPFGPTPSGPASSGPDGSPSSGGSGPTGSTGTGPTGSGSSAGATDSTDSPAFTYSTGSTASTASTASIGRSSDAVQSDGTAQTGDGERDGSQDDDARGDDPATTRQEDAYRTVPLPYRPDAQTQPLGGYPQPYTPYQPYQGAWQATSASPGSGVMERDASAGGPRSMNSNRPPRPSGPATALLLGGALIVAAVVLVLDYADVLAVANPAVVAPAAAAILLALGVIALGVRGRTSGLIGSTAALAALAALISSFTVVGGDWIVAREVRTAPASLEAASDGYSIMVAETTIDLAELPTPTRDVVVPVNSLASDVTVIVPDDVPVEIRTRMALGSADAQGSSTAFDSPSPRFQDDGGVLQLSDSELNPDATGAALILDVRGALSDVTITASGGTDTPSPGIPTPTPTPTPSPTPTPAGDTP